MARVNRWSPPARGNPFDKGSKWNWQSELGGDTKVGGEGELEPAVAD